MSVAGIFLVDESGPDSELSEHDKGRSQRLGVPLSPTRSTA